MPPRMFFNNPFAKNNLLDFLDAPVSADLEKNCDVMSSSGSSSGTSSDLYKPAFTRTVESLRAEIEEDLTTGGHDTAYNSESILEDYEIDDADILCREIQDRQQGDPGYRYG